jgi:cysteine desulfurase
VDLEELDAAMTPETSLVSIMSVNNEIGVIQPIEKIGIYLNHHPQCRFLI